MRAQANVAQREVAAGTGAAAGIQVTDGFAALGQGDIHVLIGVHGNVDAAGRNGVDLYCIVGCSLDGCHLLHRSAEGAVCACLIVAVVGLDGLLQCIRRDTDLLCQTLNGVRGPGQTILWVLSKIM